MFFYFVILIKFNKKILNYPVRNDNIRTNKEKTTKNNKTKKTIQKILKWR